MSGRLPRPVRLAIAAIAAVDRATGASRRYRAGDDLAEAFADEAAETFARRGAIALALAALAAAADLVVDGIAYSWRRPRGRRRSPSRRRSQEPPMRSFAQDLRFALRGIRRQPGFALAVVLTLSLGIAANGAIFTLCDAILLRPLPYPEPERLVRVFSDWKGERGNVNPLDVEDWRRAPALADLGAWTRTSAAMTGAGEPEMISIGYATSGFFPTLRAGAALGRVAAAPAGGGPPTELVLADGFWRRRFGGDPAIVGRSLTIAGDPYTVVGVLGRDFASPGTTAASEPQLWIPFVTDAQNGRGGHFMKSVGRLAPGASLELARAQLAEVSRRLERENPSTNHELVAMPEPLAADVAREGRPALLMLMAAVALVLLIACANVAHLLLARATARQREMAVRGALGAGRGRLVRQLLSESLVYSAIAGILGLAGAWLAIRALPSALTDALPANVSLALDVRGVGFTFAIAAAATALFGLAPAVSGTRADLRDALVSGARSTSVRAGRLQSALLVGETAIALVLLVGATLLVQSLARLERVDPGFDTGSVLTFRISLPRARYPATETRNALFLRLAERLAALPGVEAAGGVNMAPLSQRSSCDSFGLADRPAPPDGEEPCAEARVATADYFRAMGIRRLAGRGFEPADTADGAQVVIVSESMAKKYWPAGDALGQRLKWGSVASDDPWRTIVGVVADLKFFGLDADPVPEIYVPVGQGGTFSLTWAARTSRDPAALAAEARRAVAELDPELPLYEVQTTRQLVDRSTVLPRFRTDVLGAFAAIALLLALVGIYGVMAFYVAQRSREIGIRMTLGATPREVRALVMRRGMAAAAVGAGLGLVAAVPLVRLLRGMLFGVEASNPTAFVAAPLLLLATALVASLLPARRATRVDPVVAIRAE